MKNRLVLVTAAAGKTGRRVTQRLIDRGAEVREGSRSTAIPFDWQRPETFGPALDGVDAAYVCMVPDLAAPGSSEAVAAFAAEAADKGVGRLVLLSGRGEAEAQRCERAVLEAEVPATVVRAAWFTQNFTEGQLAPGVEAGVVALPAGDVREPFVDCDDIADVAVAALLDSGHEGEVYEVTGPESLSFAEATEIVGVALGREVRYAPVSASEFEAMLVEFGEPPEVAAMLGELFPQLLDGRNEATSDGVERALGRPPRRFIDAIAAAVDARRSGRSRETV
jgi:uncharacterized protein YbjT (DUF2867 family)